MKKIDKLWFSHDFNARNDLKILELRVRHGYEGYGVYWALIELMAETSDHKIKFTQIKSIAMSLPYEYEKLRSVINDCCSDEISLFERDDIFFWSESLMNRLVKIKEQRLKKQEAGRKGGLKKKQNCSNAKAVLQAQPKQNLPTNNTNNTNNTNEIREDYLNKSFEKIYSYWLEVRLKYPKSLGQFYPSVEINNQRLIKLIELFTVEKIKEAINNYAKLVEGVEQGTHQNYMKCSPKTFFDKDIQFYFDCENPIENLKIREFKKPETEEEKNSRELREKIEKLEQERKNKDLGINKEDIFDV